MYSDWSSGKVRPSFFNNMEWESSKFSVAVLGELCILSTERDQGNSYTGGEWVNRQTPRKVNIMADLRQAAPERRN